MACNLRLLSPTIIIPKKKICYESGEHDFFGRQRQRKLLAIIFWLIELFSELLVIVVA